MGSIPEAVCGGAILNENWILSAAHCFNIYYDYPDAYKIIANEYNLDLHDPDEREHKGAKFVRHPGYNRTTLQNDIALLKLTEPLKLDARASPIALPPANHTTPVGHTGRVAGWGALRSGVEYNDRPTYPRYTDLPFISKEDCGAVYEQESISLYDSMICAGELDGQADTCRGDSGDPLVADDLGYKYVSGLAGIVDYSHECGQRPGVYTDVSKFVTWIEETIATE